MALTQEQEQLIRKAFDAGWKSARQGSYKVNGTYRDDLNDYLKEVNAMTKKEVNDMTKITKEECHEDSYWRFMKAVKKLVDSELEQIEPKKEEAKKESYDTQMNRHKKNMIEAMQKDNFQITNCKLVMNQPEPDYFFASYWYPKGYERKKPTTGTVTIDFIL